MYHIVTMVLIKNTLINLCGFIHFPFKWESSETSFGCVSEHKESWKKLKVEGWNPKNILGLMNTLCFKSKLKDLQQIEAETIVTMLVPFFFSLKIPVTSMC